MIVARLLLLFLGIPVLFCGAIFAQASRFDAVSVKPSGTNHYISHGPSGPIQMNTRGFRYEGGRVTCNLSLVEIIEEAFAVKYFQVAGPAWIQESTYQLIATMPPATPKERARLMLQSMLAERFAMRSHREQRDIPVYELTESKDGFLLKPVADLEKQKERTIDTPMGPQKGVAIARSPGSFQALAISMGDFAGQLSSILDRPVINAMKLDGVYEINLRWTPQPGTGPERDADLPGVIEQKLGLAIRPRKAPFEVLVIDAVQKTPTEN